jgi:selenocysteine-specific elongation factor
MRTVVFGTAGHIDHGKTSLVRALTGVDCDRLPEEKRRGITLVLGFAPLADPRGELEVSFIDVPGHERLVHTMIAGAGGIDRALLVVAADEGVMPQTREHLDILALLGVRGGVVALNKADLLEADLIELRREEVAEALRGGPLAGAPLVVCSASTGSGVESLRDVLLACARGVMREEERHRPFRMAVDRSFSLPGIGTVVTGTARWGRVRTGDELLALPTGRSVRVRGVQVHGASREEARPGERTALRLAG